MWLVVGLGNPGPTHASNRHNVGFWVVQELARRDGGSWLTPRGMRARAFETRIGPLGVGVPSADAVRVTLVEPRTYMNESGVAVRALADFARVEPDRICVVHDELDLEPGRLRLKLGGGDNGHNGLRSIRAHLGTGDFLRLRFGIGRPPGRQSVHDWVLGNPPARELTDLRIDASRAADAVESLVIHGLAATQNAFH